MDISDIIDRYHTALDTSQVAYNTTLAEQSGWHPWLAVGFLVAAGIFVLLAKKTGEPLFVVPVAVLVVAGVTALIPMHPSDREFADAEQARTVSEESARWKAAEKIAGEVQNMYLVDVDPTVIDEALQKGDHEVTLFGAEYESTEKSWGLRIDETDKIATLYQGDEVMEPAK